MAKYPFFKVIKNPKLKFNSVSIIKLKGGMTGTKN